MPWALQLKLGAQSSRIAVHQVAIVRDSMGQHVAQTFDVVAQVVLQFSSPGASIATKASEAE